MSYPVLLIININRIKRTFKVFLNLLKNMNNFEKKKYFIFIELSLIFQEN